MTARRGMSMIEVVFAAAMLAVGAVSIVTAVGHAGTTSAAAERTSLGVALTSELIDEILALPAFDGDARPPLGGEGTKEPRDTFTAAVRFDGLLESPPRERDGRARARSRGWSRGVTVSYAKIDHRGVARSAEPTDAILMEVWAARQGRRVTSLDLVRTAAGDVWRGLSNSAPRD